MMFPPFYGKPEMMAECLYLLLLLPLSVIVSQEFRVVQPEAKLINPDGSVTIDCELHGSKETWMMQRSLRWNGSVVCLVPNNMCPRLSDTNPCIWRNSSWNHFQFTLFNPRLDSGVAYVCEVKKLRPTPVVTKQGRGTRLVSAPVHQCPPAEPASLNWVLMGLTGSLLLCCLAVTYAYIRLRVQLEREMDGSLTYVPMQAPQSHTGNMRNGDPESNTTYMDMRKMQLQGRISQRVSTTTPIR